jgi:SAM-dependent methyltransferase
MKKEYDEITAFHYASYRPFLHTEILKNCFGNVLLESGLDIGSGTGQSAIALANFCNSVEGIEPSVDMILKAIASANVTYSIFDKTHIDFEDQSFEVITLAGSLWYAKSQNLLDEILRVSRKNALIIIYDFEILLNDILKKIGFISNVNQRNLYNHEEDFSGLNVDGLVKVKKQSEKISFIIKPAELAHLILSVKEQYLALSELYDSSRLFDAIVAKLNSISSSGQFQLEAHTFSTIYRVN